MEDSEFLVLGNVMVSPIDGDNEIEILIEDNQSMATEYLTLEQIKQLHTFLTEQLKSIGELTWIQEFNPARYTTSELYDKFLEERKEETKTK